MSALAAATEDSKGALALRGVVAALAVAGAVLLVWAELSPLYQVKALDVVVKVERTGPHNSWALVLVAAAALVMAYGAVRTGSRPALVALAVLGLVAALIALLVDLPDTHAAGLIGERFESAEATARAGLALELAGAATLAVAAVAGLVGLARRE